MRFTRDRYVTICQQFLVTAAVVAVGASAAGVMTLQIVTPEAQSPRVDESALGMQVTDGYVAKRPVAPKVRSVKVPGIAGKAPQPKATSKTVDAAPRKLAALSAPTRVEGYATVGVTWKQGADLAEDDISVQVRTRTDGTWSGWTTAEYHDEHGPDAGSDEAKAAVRPGTDAVVVGDVDEVQMRAETKDGTAPADLELAVIDPGKTDVVEQPAAIDTSKLPAEDRDATSSAPISSTAGMGGTRSAATHGDGAAADLDLVAMKTAPKPYIFSRAQWGANESLRDKSSLRYGTVKAGFIHHTVNANNYSEQQVPALLRGIYAYHTQSRGWSDIGYNFLVDRFGRIWEGRYGGVDRAVVGAHTLGYNEYAFAMSAIGDFDKVEPPQVMLNSYAKLFAWKLSLYSIKANATHLYVKNRYLNAINGHRDAGQTACPGRYLYAKLSAVRSAAALIQGAVQLTGDPVKWPILPTPAGVVPPTTTPKAAVAQPTISFPLRRNLASTAYSDMVVKSPAGLIKVLPTQGILGYRGSVVSKGDWSGMSLITAIGDVTGDGKSDVLAKATKAAWVFRGDGLGHVSRAGVAETLAFNRVDMIVGVRDFNRDGRNDVVGRDKTTSALLLYRGAGNGTFKAPIVLRKQWPYSGTVGVGDFNGDRKPDLMAVAGGRTLYLFPGTTGTALGAKVGVVNAPAELAGLLSWGDLTGDGRADVMTRTAGTLIGKVYAGTGSGKVAQVWGSFSTFRGLSKASLAPMVGSAAADVVGRDSAGRLVVVPHTGKRNLSSPMTSNLKVTAATQVLNVGDWNRDGRGDVIVRSAGGNLLVLYPGLGNGRFGRGLSLGSGWSSVTRLTAVGDVTGDGRPDLLGRIGTGPMTIFPGYGTKAFKAPQLAPDTLKTYNQIGSAAWSPSGSAFKSADGSFVPTVASKIGYALQAANGTEETVYDTYIGVGDVDGDYVADLLAREKGTGIIWLLPGKTSGGLAPRMWVANGFAGYQLIG